MGRRYIVSAFGKDRPGIVADVTRILYENGCNLEDSRMANLAGEFSLLILFATATETDDVPERLSDAFNRLERDNGITSYFRPVTAPSETPAPSIASHTIRVEGLDHTGIVHQLSGYLADHDVNIANLESSIQYAPQSGASIYAMSIDIQMPERLSMDAFKAGLDCIADQLHVDIALDSKDNA